MIKDSILNCKKYYNLHPLFKCAFESLLSDSLKPGKNNVIEDKLYINLDEYKTVETKLYEAHKRYIDIQYIIEGSEKIGITEDELEIEIPYDDKCDIEFYKTNGNIKYTSMNKGDFIILYPKDKHMPCIKKDKAQNVKKAVAKVLIES